MMPDKPKFIQLPPVGKIFLVLLAVVYLATLVPLTKFLYSSDPVIEHTITTSEEAIFKFWTVARMRNAINADVLTGATFQLTDEKAAPRQGTPARQDGVPPSSGEKSYPLSTVGKVFFSSGGQSYVCSGTAVVSNNKSVVDTAGHCLYYRGNWSDNVLFCPLYNNGTSPYGCWAARETIVAAEWVEGEMDALHRDLGLAVVSPNESGTLIDMVGGAGWAYNQDTNQIFSAYGYPAGSPFDGKTRKSCEERTAKSWAFGDGTVISIPCNMTGGSSGGPWYFQKDGKWYLNGHNDFTSSAQPGHMFSPYYDDVWYALYEEAQNS